MNRGWRFCRPLPYHLATAPAGTVLVQEGQPRLDAAATTTARLTARVRLKPDTTYYGQEHHRHRHCGPPSLAARASAGQPSPGLPTVARVCGKRERRLERETGFEPATSTLARSHSTTELFPPATNEKRTTADQSQSRRPPAYGLSHPPPTIHHPLTAGRRAGPRRPPRAEWD